MRKRPTPETDAVAAYEGNWDTKALRMTAHSRKLERERDEAREEIRDWKRLHDAAERGVDLTIAEGTISDLLKQRDEARRELKFLWRERDEARELLASEKITRNHIIKRSVEVERERDEAREKAERYRIEANSIMLQRDEARSLTEHQWLLKVGSRLFVAGCKSDGIIDSLDEIIRERDELRKQNSKLISIAERAINIGRIIK